MGFYNVQLGDMPYFTKLARKYAISDNYHQPVMGGTGANSIMLGAADLDLARLAAAHTALLGSSLSLLRRRRGEIADKRTEFAHRFHLPRRCGNSERRWQIG